MEILFVQRGCFFRPWRDSILSNSLNPALKRWAIITLVAKHPVFFATLCLCGSHRAKPAGYQIFGAACHDQFLGGRTEGRKANDFSSMGNGYR